MWHRPGSHLVPSDSSRPCVPGGRRLWLALLIAASTIGILAEAVAPRERLDDWSARPGATLPVVREQIYRMSGSIRPLLFWVSRDRVGAGRIVWRRGTDGARAYELLIGSDPALAPRKLNRWGYLAEDTRSSSSVVLGIISADDGDTLAGVTADGIDRLPESYFKTIAATVGDDQASAQISTLGAAQDLTFHEVETVLDLLDRQSESVESRVVMRPSGTRSGFLAVMSEILHRSVEDANVSPHADRLHVLAPLVYMHGEGLHDLSVRSLRFHARRRVGDREYADVIHGKFQTRSRMTGDRKRFEIIYGTRDSLAEVPIWIRYLPHWWLRVDLTLEDSPSADTQ